MAGTTVLATPTAPPGADVAALRLEHNKLVDDLETLRASVAAIVTKLNADSGVNDTDYAVSAAAALTGAKVADNNGVTT